MTQTQKVKTKKKKRRKMTPIMKLLCLVMIGASFFLLYQVGREVYTTVTLRHDITEAEEKYQKILDESAYLSSEREKLTDPNYVQSYARGNYMLSKDGEQIFYLPEKDK